MPELPEVEVVRPFLEKSLIGQTIKKIEIYNSKTFIGDPKLVERQKINKLTRIGKQLSIHLQNKLVILIHLKMTGQLVFIPLSSKGDTRREGDFVFGHPTPHETKKWPNKSTRLQFIFSDNSKLFFNDQRKFGWVKILTQAELVEAQSNLGFDILAPNFTLDYFKNELKKTTRPIKTVLLDQSKFAGIGNIYANDALFISKINPQTSANKITQYKVAILWRSLIDLINESIKHGGSTAKDNKYIHPDGSVGAHQYHFRVYQKAGKSCSVCGTPIRRISLGGRGTFFVPTVKNRSNLLPSLMIKAFVFDIGNIVFSYQPLFNQLFQAWANLLGISFDQFWNAYLKVYIDFETDNLKFDDWIHQLNPNLNSRDFHSSLQQILGNFSSYSPYLDQNIINKIQELKSPTIKVGCLSNVENFIVPFHQPIYSLFDFAILSCQEKCRKPDPEIYQQIFKHVNCQPNEVVFIDDRLENVEGAVNLGINGILFENYPQLTKDLTVFQQIH